MTRPPCTYMAIVENEGVNLSREIELNLRP